MIEASFENTVDMIESFGGWGGGRARRKGLRYGFMDTSVPHSGCGGGGLAARAFIKAHQSTANGAPWISSRRVGRSRIRSRPMFVTSIA